MAAISLSACDKYGLMGSDSKISCAKIVSDQTKAAPVESGNNLGVTYGKFVTTAYLEDRSVYSGDLNVAATGSGMLDVIVTYSSEDTKWYFSGLYYWPGNQYLYFCSMAPHDASSKEVSNLTFNYLKHLAFDYALPAHAGTNIDAENQRDFMLAIDRQSMEYYGTEKKQGDEVGAVKVHFRHALTAVKFIKGDITGKIESISLNNFYRTGHAVYDGTGFTWSEPGNLASFTQSFDDYDVTSLASGSSLDKSDDGSRTFMMIPQDLSTRDADKHAIISIKLSGVDEPISLDLTALTKDNLFEGATDADVAALQDWSGYAGRSITLKVNKKVIVPVSIGSITVNSFEDAEGINVEVN